MSKKVVFGDKGRSKIEIGVDAVGDAVKVTLGAQGRNAVLDRGKHIPPLITNDGVTIAKEIVLEDPIENMGAQLVKEVAIKTNNIAGDGSTTSIVLAQAIIKEGIKNVTAGANPIELNKGIEKATLVVVKGLVEGSTTVETNEDIVNIATISSASVDVGEMVGEAMEKVGNKGVITISESQTMETTCEVVEGMEIDSGFASVWMTNSSDRTLANMQSPYVCIVNEHIKSFMELLPVIEMCVNAKRGLLLIADDITDEALGLIIENKMKGLIDCVVVKSPSFGDNRVDILNDIAILTGGAVLSSVSGVSVEEVTIDMLGAIDSAKISSATSILVGGQGDEKLISERVKTIEDKISSCKSEHFKSSLKSRVARLTSGVAVISVGAPTTTEIEEKTLRLEDALNATRAGVEEGIVAGGGIALLDTCGRVDDLINTLDGDEKLGAKIIRKAIQAPVRQILKNAGIEDSVVVNNILSERLGVGYDVKSGKYVYMVKSGIVDPTKVTRSAIQNASSIARMLLTTEAIVYKTDKKDSELL